jgi:3-oxoacyl-(acyl-carrier-protein) synthase
MPVFIQSANQISVQKPLSDEWFHNPIYYDEKRVSTIDPDFKTYLSPLASRRMCSLLKRAIILSRLTLKDAGVETPDAIISGTGLGCIENTEKFLMSITQNDEKFLQPTYFMQSTHNILSSTIAIELQCHGYNNTFVHRGTSFENALLDAMLQFEHKKVETSLLGGYEELTDNYYTLFDKMGVWDFEPGTSFKEKCFASEAAVSMLLTNRVKADTLCEITGVETMYCPTHEQVKDTLNEILKKADCKLTDIDAVFMGINSNKKNDDVYNNIISNVLDSTPKVVRYKHIFGESFCTSALAVYAAAKCLKNGMIPSFLVKDSEEAIKDVKKILLYNHYNNKSHSLILLSSC